MEAWILRNITELNDRRRTNSGQQTPMRNSLCETSGLDYAGANDVAHHASGCISHWHATAMQHYLYYAVPRYAGCVYPRAGTPSVSDEWAMRKEREKERGKEREMCVFRALYTNMLDKSKTRMSRNAISII